MADDPITDAPDKPEEAPVVEGAAPAPADADKVDESYMLDFADREKAEAGFKELPRSRSGPVTPRPSTRGTARMLKSRRLPTRYKMAAKKT